MVKKKIAQLVAVAMTLSFIVGTQVFGYTLNEKIHVKANQEWEIRGRQVRNEAYIDVLAKCYAVYPDDGSRDNYRYIQVKLFDVHNETISDVYRLDEQKTSYTSISLHNGKLDNETIKYVFRGNDPRYSAYADVEYDLR